MAEGGDLARVESFGTIYWNQRKRLLLQYVSIQGLPTTLGNIVVEMCSGENEYPRQFMDKIY